ncbi:MAG: ribose-phosphate diphosphokinase [Holosporales bacterium]|jgi:ribose-phosphate pyrophosphokinase|nr:ribose-phosphate diphosphokinase [Holosporales bacterium]
MSRGFKKNFLRLLTASICIITVHLTTPLENYCLAADSSKNTRKNEAKKTGHKNIRKDVKILTCSNAKEFIYNLTNFDRSNIFYTNVSKFDDGESLIKIDDGNKLQGEKVLIVQSISGDINDAFMELVFAANIAHSLGAGEIYLLIPYLGYSRQDRVRTASEAFSAKVIANILSQPYIKKIFLVKLHADQIQGFFNVPTVNINTNEFFAETIKRNHDLHNSVLIAPDAGAAKSIVVPIAEEIKVDLRVATKRRSKDGSKSEIVDFSSEGLKGKICIIIDDIVDSGGTLCNVAEKIAEQGAKEVIAYMTHPVLSPKAMDRINKSCITKLYVGDTIDAKEKAAACKKINILSISDWCVKKVMSFIS